MTEPTPENAQPFIKLDRFQSLFFFVTQDWLDYIKYDLCLAIVFKSDVYRNDGFKHARMQGSLVGVTNPLPQASEAMNLHLPWLLDIGRP